MIQNASIQNASTTAPGSRQVSTPELIYVTTPTHCCNTRWEDAYARFETPEQERRKFLQRLRTLGAAQWRRDSRVVELCCGRANGLAALEQLGFSELEGIDLSERLLRQYQGAGRLYVCDCRQLPFADNSRDVILVQGGLHHLSRLPDDLEATCREVHRVLTADGRFVVVEPWRTPFLNAIHALSRRQFVRRRWAKLNAFATMVEEEAATYFDWLSRQAEILGVLRRFFAPEFERRAWGKLLFAGRPKDLA